MGEYLKLSLMTGTPLDYWEGLTMRRLHRWTETWNRYAEAHKKR